MNNVVYVLKLPATFEAGVAYMYNGQIYTAPGKEWHASSYPAEFKGNALQGKKVP